MYHGENRGFGAHFSYLFNKKEAVKSDIKADAKKGDKNISDKKVGNEISWDSLTLKIYDGDRLIRTLKQKAPKDNGLHKWTWYMNEAGVSRPSRRVRKQKQRNQVEFTVKTRKIIRLFLHYGDITSENNDFP